jgi:pyridoxamine 5'-phosphate oxidase
MRENYEAACLLEKDCAPDPVDQFEKWFREAIDGRVDEPNAMAVATCGADGQPSVRMVLLKSFDHDGFVFYSNYESRKGSQIIENAKVSLLFWWAPLQRQVRIEGLATQTPRALNELYFHSRPRGSQIAATVSEQSRVIESREALEQLYQEKEKELGDGEIPLKKNWGGYLVAPSMMEFWQGRASRLHDRIRYTKEESQWKAERLAP